MDAALTERYTQLLWRMLEEAEDVLERGSPRDRMRLITANLPAMAKALHQDEASQMEAARNAVTELMVEVRKGLVPPPDEAA